MKKYFTVSHIILFIIIIVLAVLNIKQNIIFCKYNEKKTGGKDISKKIEYDFKTITKKINFNEEQIKLAESIKNELILLSKQQRELKNKMLNEFIDLFKNDNFDTMALFENHKKNQEISTSQFYFITEKFKVLHDNITVLQRNELAEIFRTKFNKKK
ncbi:hypothetical protein KA977_05090 [Candidatus Dependentiae bacterium]|nr:hypothetical protein [Candidatus Dependentiae bacterium]